MLIVRGTPALKHTAYSLNLSKVLHASQPGGKAENSRCHCPRRMTIVLLKHALSSPHSSHALIVLFHHFYDLVKYNSASKRMYCTSQYDEFSMGTFPSRALQAGRTETTKWIFMRPHGKSSAFLSFQEARTYYSSRKITVQFPLKTRLTLNPVETY